MKKIILVLVAIIIILGIGVFYFWFKTTTIQPDKLISDEFSFIVHVQNIKQLLTAIEQPTIRDGLLLNQQTLQFYNLYNKTRTQFNKLGPVDTLLLNQPFRLVILKDYSTSPLLIFDSGIKTVFLAQSLKTLPLLVKDEQNLRVNITNHQKTDIYELIILSKKSKWYLAPLKNLVIVSSTKEVITKTLDNLAGKSAVIHNNIDYLQVKSKLPSTSIARTYFTSNLILNGLETTSQTYQILSSVLGLNKIMGLALNERNGLITISSFNSIETKEKLFTSPPQELKLKEIVPANCELFFGLAFENFKILWDYILGFSKQDPEFVKQLETGRDLFKKVTGQSIEDSLLSWVGNELGVIYMPTFSGPKQVLALRLADKREAMDSFNKLEKNLAAQVFLGLTRAPYGRYHISRIDQPFLFKLLLGVFIGKKVEMYYTFIENYLVFGDDIESIKSLLDNKESNNTLAKDDKFQNITTDWFPQGNVFCYWNIGKRTTLLPKASAYVKSIMNLYSTGGLCIKFADQGMETRLALAHSLR